MPPFTARVQQILSRVTFDARIGASNQLIRADVVRFGIIGVRHTLIGIGPVAYRTSTGVTDVAYRLGQEIALAVRLKRESDMIRSGIGALGIQHQYRVVY